MVLRLLLLASTVASAGAAQPPHAARTPCVPSQPTPEGVPAGDSATIAGRRVPRTAAAVRAAHLDGRARSDGSQFHAGERVVMTLDGRRLGTAIFDGCRFVPESPRFAPTLVASTVARAEVLPVDAAGYQTLAFRTATAGDGRP